MKIKKAIFIFFIIFYFFEKVNAEIKDALFMTIGEKAITQFDVVNEIKILLVLNNEIYSDKKRDILQKLSVNSIIKRKVKEIEIERNNFSDYNQKDVDEELLRLASNINVDLETLKNICESNDLDFSIIVNNIKNELIWQGLIYNLYMHRIVINQDEIDEELKKNQNESTLNEFLISEILIKPVDNNLVEQEVNKIKERIKIDGFENVAKNVSISESSLTGGDLGWLKESSISEKIKSTIINTQIGELSDPIILPEGILFFKIRDKRKIDHNLSLDEKKETLVRIQKIKILNMYSLSHYDKVRRTVQITFFK